ncbi:MAG: PDZ domain-containing protein [Lysobacteraceae bacterium]
MRPLLRPTLLGLTLATLLAGGLARAAETPDATPADAARRAQLEAARADMERATRRYLELSRQYGAHAGPYRFEAFAPHPVLGVLLAPDADAGVRIAGVTPGSAAEKAGLRSGDRLLAIDGHEVLGSDGELRVANARRLLGKLDTRTPVRITYQRDGRRSTVGATPQREDQVVFWRGVAPPMPATPPMPPVPPEIDERLRREIVRIAPDAHCEGAHCGLPLLAEAFRWNGLNLASVDPQLGRYFGTDSGVLVLSTGQALAGLQAGDVLRSVDGKPVRTPREAMAALDAHPAGSQVTVEYLRDRRSASARVTVPKAKLFEFPAPPVPPAAPAPPAAAPRAPAAPPTPPAAAPRAPAAPPPLPRVSDAGTPAGEGVLLAQATLPPAIAPAPPAGELH